MPLQTDCHPACARLFSCFPVLGTRATCSSSAGTFTITVAAEHCRGWKGTAFTEKMNAEHEDEEFVGLRVSGHTRQNNDPPPEFTGTEPSEFKNYREKVRRWLLFPRTPAQLQGPHVLSRLTLPAWDPCDELQPEDVFHCRWSKHDPGYLGRSLSG